MAQYILRRNCFSLHFAIAWALICNWLVVSQQSSSRIINGIAITKDFPLSNGTKETIEHHVPHFLDRLDQTTRGAIKIRRSVQKPRFESYRYSSSKENNTLKTTNFSKSSTASNKVNHNSVHKKKFKNKSTNSKNKNRGFYKNEKYSVVNSTRGSSAIVESNAEKLKNNFEDKKISFVNNSTYRKIKGKCQRKPYYISFEKLGWNEWIVAPPGFNAYYCDGQTKYIDNKHGKLMKFIGYKIPSDIPESCCVPTKYSAVSILFHDENDKINLKNFHDYVVESCGCR